MTNGENTAFMPIREYLTSRGYPGIYGLSIGFRGIHPHPALHHNSLGLGLDAYKHIITPLKDEEL